VVLEIANKIKLHLVLLLVLEFANKDTDINTEKLKSMFIMYTIV